MRVLVTYGRRPPYPPFGVHLVRAFRALGCQAALLSVRDRPWWGTAAKRVIPEPWKSRWQWDPAVGANRQVRIAVEHFRPDLVD